jgi:Leucine-rich repeat (LRR) protein
MSDQLNCPDCGSSIIARSQEDEGFVCMNCKHIFPYGEENEEYKYSLNLVDYGLTEIPDWVYERKYLKEIDLSAEPDDPFHAPFVNRISVISSGIGQLSDLEELDISSNSISFIPSEISKCQNLRYLYLGRNFIKEIPEELCSLSKLDSLNLRYNRIEYIPSCIGRLTNLTWLSLSGNLLKSLPDEIGLLTNLKTLNLENNKLRSLPESIINLINLEEFRISGNTDLTSPPYDIAVQGLLAIMDWFDKS